MHAHNIRTRAHRSHATDAQLRKHACSTRALLCFALLCDALVCAADALRCPLWPRLPAYRPRRLLTAAPDLRPAPPSPRNSP